MNNTKKLAVFIAITTFIISATLFSIAIKITIENTRTPIPIEHHTQDEIIQKAKKLNIDFSLPDAHEKDYDIENRVMGKVSAKTEQASLNLLNFYRYVAGLPDDVELREDYVVSAQAGALVNAANDKMTHHPDEPENINHELYEVGKKACSESNLAWNHGSLLYSMVNGWMDDSNKSNIEVMGHRRWVLSPYMKYTGFGSVGAYTTMYALDNNRKTTISDEYIAWPAANTPVEMFKGSVFTVTLGENFDEPQLDNVEITLTSKSQDKTWTINKDNKDVSFYISNDNYCMPKCIIFKVTDFNNEDDIHIEITGITKNKKETPIEYDVHLFSVSKLQTNHPTIKIQQNHIADVDIIASSLFSSKEPPIKWESADSEISDIYYCPDIDELKFYGVEKGHTTIKASIPGAEQIFDITVY